jgi:DNA mismatch repair protein MutL
VANQIAAGEVVERPASVVKELVENALDAGASRLTIEIQHGGRSLIRVADDGSGMSRDDALLCLERHATSKLQTAADLACVRTLGFRGEALPSIASVSRFTLTTRERDAQPPTATQVIVSGGRIQEVREAGGPPGTTVEVRQLFFNVPARRKFLRAEETERARIQHSLLLVALAYPHVGLTFSSDEHVVWRLPPLPRAADTAGSLEALRERLRLLYGGELHLLPLERRAEWDAPALAPRHDAGASGEVPAPTRQEFRVWGFIGAPGTSRATRQDQHLFVNQRPIEHRGLSHALIEGYHTALMKGRFPVCCLFLELDPAEVDVNIHPAKREVRFHCEREVQRAVAQAVRDTLVEAHTTTRPLATPAPAPASAAATQLDLETRPPPVSSSHPPPPHAATRPAADAAAPAALTPPAPPALPAPGAPPTSSTRPVFSGVPGTPTVARLTTPAAAPASVQPAQPPQPPVTPATTAAPLLSVPLRIIGVVGRLYVLLESDRGLVLMDQHAAHERVLYEQMLRQVQQGEAPSQRLLLPETVELAPTDAAAVRENLATLNRLGVVLSEFGNRTFLLEALPPFVKAPDSRRFVLQLIDELQASGQDVNSWRLGEDVVAKTVCRHAVKAHDVLQGPELDRLLELLRLCAMPYTCPHGRPTLIEMNFRELEKKFGRIQNS